MNNASVRIIITLALIALLPSCITNKQKAYLQEEGNSRMYQAVPFEEYKLRVDDEIIYYLMSTNSDTQYLYNLGEQNSMNSAINNANPVSFRIYEDGCVVLPTIGKVDIEGLTLREAEQVVRDKFKTLVNDAEIKLALTNNYFYVEGNNGKGRFFAYKENLNIFQALAMAGDISSTGDKSKIKIIRRGDDGKDHVSTIDVRKESIIESEFYYIRPNDVIYIPTNANSFFRLDSFSGFVSLVLTPLALLAMTLSYFKKN